MAPASLAIYSTKVSRWWRLTVPTGSVAAGRASPTRMTP
jgi:hypothetical protein